MTYRAIAVVAGTALVVFLASAFRLASADPLASPAQPRPAAARRERPAPAAPATATAPAAEWKSRKQTGVSAGVLVRAASRKPLQRGPACPPPDGAQAPEEAAASGCTEARAHREPIEIDWHADRAAP